MSVSARDAQLTGGKERDSSPDDAPADGGSGSGSASVGRGGDAGSGAGGGSGGSDTSGGGGGGAVDAGLPVVARRAVGNADGRRTHNALGSVDVSSRDADADVSCAVRHFRRIGGTSTLITTVVLQVTHAILVTLLAITRNDAGAEVGRFLLYISCTALQLVQMFILVTVTWWVVTRIRQVKLRDAWMFYSVTFLSFGGVYSLLESYVGNAFDVSKHVDVATDAPHEWLYYYSLTVQTLVGLGDISPAHGFAKATTSVQTVMGLFYHIFIISQLANQLQRPVKHVHASAKPMTCRRKMSRIPWLKSTRKRVRRYLLVVSGLLQLVNFLVLFLGERNVFALADVRLELLLPSAFIQLVQVLFVLATSVKLARKTYKVTFSFLVQSYLSVMMAFAGVYMVVFLLRPNHPAFNVFCGVGDPECKHADHVDEDFWLVAYRFLYFSISVMTTCGFGDISASVWYARVVVMMQMLVSVFFSTVIFGLGLKKLARYGTAPPRYLPKARESSRSQLLDVDPSDVTDADEAERMRRTAKALKRESSQRRNQLRSEASQEALLPDGVGVLGGETGGDGGPAGATGDDGGEVAVATATEGAAAGAGRRRSLDAAAVVPSDASAALSR